MQDVIVGIRPEGEALVLPSKPGEHSGLCPDKQAQDLDMTKEIRMKEKFWCCHQNLENTVDFVQTSRLKI